MPLTDREETPHDDLFNALDGRSVSVGDRAWRLHVYSVRELNNAIWLQLDVVGTPTYVLTLRQPHNADAASVVVSIERYLRAAQDASDSVVFDRILNSTLTAVPAPLAEAAFTD